MLLFHMLFSLAITAVAVAIWMRISALPMPSFDRVAPKYSKLTTSSTVHGDVDTDLICTVYHDLGFLCADFHAIHTGSCSKSVHEVLELIAAALHKVNVICKLEVAEWPAANGDGGVVVLEYFLHDYFQEQIE